MKTLSFFLILFLLSSRSFSSEYLPAVEELKTRPIGSILIEALSGTASRISTDKNIVLTNLHTSLSCFRFSEIDTKRGFSVRDIIGTQECYSYQPRTTTSEKFSGIAIGLAAGAKGIIEDDYGNSAKRIYSHPDDYLVLLEKGYYYYSWGSSLDFAVIEFTQPKWNKPELKSKWDLNNCLATQKIDKQKPVETFGYPYFDRPNLKSRYDPMRSTGKLITDLQQKRDFLRDSFDEQTSQNIDRLLDVIFEKAEDRVFLSSIDASPGGSGSPVLQNGRIVGLLFAGDPRSKSTYVKDSALFTNIDHIKEKLESRGFPVQDWFDCPQ